MTSVSKVFMASDHAGLELKNHLKSVLESSGRVVEDLGAHTTESVDYPDFGASMGAALTNDQSACGILVCGTGIGISIAANRFSHIRAAVCHDETTARLARLHNDANVLCLGERVVGRQTAQDCVSVFLETDFEGGRHQRRVDKLTTIGA